MLIGVLSAHSWTQAQNSPPTNEVMIDIDTTASWEKIKKEKTNLALKTNLLYAATLTPNLGLEIGITPQISLNIVGSYNPWNREGKKGDNDKLVHWLVQPEVRYWLCEASNGIVQFTFDKTDNRDWCCNKSEHAEKTYFGPTQIGISLIYNIK